MLFTTKYNAVCICLLICVIFSDYASGKLRRQPSKKSRTKDRESLEDNQISAGDAKKAGDNAKSQAGSKEPAQDSKGSQEDSKGSGEDSKGSGGDSKESGEGSQGSGRDSKESGEDSQASDGADSLKGKKQKKNDDKPSSRWDRGTVPYRIDKKIYDKIIIRRIEEAMKAIEAASCVIFKNMSKLPVRSFGLWLHITNPEHERDCVHETKMGKRGETVMVIGFECMRKRDIIHSLLHALGFKDEVTHPQRDSYVRVLWENIQPKYQPLFAIQNEPPPYQTLVEYDTMSVMHFHDRAYSSNGAATVTPLISGLVINPTDGLSQLDIMKLRLTFGQECNKRKVEDLLSSCKQSLLKGEGDSGSESGSGSKGSKEASSGESDSKADGNEILNYKKDKNKKRYSNESDGDADSDYDDENKMSEKVAESSSDKSGEKEGTDTGSDELTVVDINHTNLAKKSLMTNENLELAGSKFGTPGLKKRRARRHMKSKHNKKNKKERKTRQKHMRTKEISKYNKSRKHYLREI